MLSNSLAKAQTLETFAYRAAASVSNEPDIRFLMRVTCHTNHTKWNIPFFEFSTVCVTHKGHIDMRVTEMMFIFLTLFAKEFQTHMNTVMLDMKRNTTPHAKTWTWTLRMARFSDVTSEQLWYPIMRALESTKHVLREKWLSLIMTGIGDWTKHSMHSIDDPVQARTRVEKAMISMPFDGSIIRTYSPNYTNEPDVLNASHFLLELGIHVYHELLNENRIVAWYAEYKDSSAFQELKDLKHRSEQELFDARNDRFAQRSSDDAT